MLTNDDPNGYQQRAIAAQASAAHAYARLLSLAEDCDSGQVRRILRSRESNGTSATAAPQSHRAATRFW